MKKEEIKSKIESEIKEALTAEQALIEPTIALLAELLEAHEKGTSDALQAKIKEEYKKLETEFNTLKETFQQKFFGR